MRYLIPCVLLSVWACGEGNHSYRSGRIEDDGGMDAAALVDATTFKQTPGVCKLSKCPVPDTGIACCTPQAECGMDPTGLGLNCVPLPGSTSSAEAVCTLKDCPKPTSGDACCTPFAECGFDPFGNGIFCFANPASTADAGMSQPACDLTKCPEVDDGGAAACCLSDGTCGVDTFGVGVCFAPPPATGPTQPEPPVSTTPPNDPSITGECPSYLDVTGPVWGCCSDYGVCGTFAADACLIPIGSEIPVVLPTDEDGGKGHAYPLCVPPKKK
jgi:hypothetical protein